MDSLDLTRATPAADDVRVASPRGPRPPTPAPERRGPAETAAVRCGAAGQVDEVLQRYGPDGWAAHSAIRCVDGSIELTLVRSPA